MKKGFIIIAIVSILLNIGLVYLFVFKGEVIQLENNRQAIVISEENKEYVLAEMRSFLESVQQINQGILEENPELIIKASNNAGNVMAGKTPKGLMGKLPISFKKLGFATHDLFGQISQETKDHFDVKKTQKKLNLLLNNCVTCHRTYTIRTK
jgi:hypothetical protein